MGFFSSSSDDKYAKEGRRRVEVHTNKRSYSWLGGKSVVKDDDEYVERAETKGFWGGKK